MDGVQRRTFARIVLFLGAAILTCIFLLVSLFALDGHNRLVHAATICNVKSYGATGNGTTKDTIAIQKAIDTCASSSSGIVEFSSGTFLTAPLFLKSGITLQVDSNATILGSTTVSDYTIPSGVTVTTKVLALINGYNVNNIAITGGGTIDGQGAPWWASGLAASARPRLIMVDYVNNLAVTNITLKNAGAMHLFFEDTTNAVIDTVTIQAPATSPNTDGIDPASSRNVTIKNCNVSVGDDNIAIKSGKAISAHPNDGTDGILVEQCKFGSGHGVSIGSETNGGVQNVQVLNSSFTGTTNGIRIKSARGEGGTVSGILYQALTMTNVTHPIIFTEYYPKIPTTDTPQPITNTTPAYHDIRVVQLQATGASDIGDIVGLPETPLKNITLNNVQISAGTGLVVRNATVTVNSSTKLTVSSGPAYILQTGAVIVNA